MWNLCLYLHMLQQICVYKLHQRKFCYLAQFLNRNLLVSECLVSLLGQDSGQSHKFYSKSSDKFNILYLLSNYMSLVALFLLLRLFF